MTVYVFEGLDGTGKGSVLSSLVTKLGAVEYKTPFEPFQSQRRAYNLARLDELAGDERRQFLLGRIKFFLGANLQAAAEVFHLKECIVIDRWVYTTLAYHYAFDPELEGLLDSAPYASILRPAHTFLMSVSDRSEWLTRMRKRAAERPDGGSYVDRWLMRDPELADRIMDNYRRLIPSYTEVSNDGSLTETVGLILDQMSA